jgi:hypothetical protein
MIFGDCLILSFVSELHPLVTTSSLTLLPSTPPLPILLISGDLPDLAPEEALSSMNPPQRTGTGRFQDKDKDTSYLDSSPRKLPSSSQGTKIYTDDSKISCSADSAADEVTDHKSERSAKSSAYTPSRNAMMKAGWFGVLDNSVSSANDITAANIPSSRPKAILEVEVEEDVEDEETRFNSRADHQPQKRLPRFSLPKGRSDQLVSIVPSQPMSPLQSPMRLIQHPKPTWNVDSSTQTGSSLKLNGRKSRPRISKECKSCILT